MQRFMVHNTTMKQSKPSKSCSLSWTMLPRNKYEVSPDNACVKILDRLSAELRQQYLSPLEAENVIQMTINDIIPCRLLDTTTGRLCDQEPQINDFKRSTEYKELLSFTIKHADLRMERIEEVVEMHFHD